MSGRKGLLSVVPPEVQGRCPPRSVPVTAASAPPCAPPTGERPRRGEALRADGSPPCAGRKALSRWPFVSACGAWSGLVRVLIVARQVLCSSILQQEGGPGNELDHKSAAVLC